MSDLFIPTSLAAAVLAARAQRSLEARLPLHLPAPGDKRFETPQPAAPEADAEDDTDDSI